MEFTIVFWNIWLNTQLAGPVGSSAKKLLKKLDEIVDTYDPDCIGLNEVLQETSTQKLFVLDHLRKRGYSYQHFAYASPINNAWGIGAALVSRKPLQNIEEIVMGRDTFATWRGYKGHTVKAISARVKLNSKKSLEVMVAHPLAIKPVAIREHWRNQKVLRKTVRLPRYKQLILGGDFNEFNHMPFSFMKRERGRFYHQSGTRKVPTWTHNGEYSKFLRCNLDKVFWTKESTTELFEFKVLHSSPSDHAPLIAHFKV